MLEFLKKTMPKWANSLYKNLAKNTPSARKVSSALAMARRERQEKTNTLLRKLYGRNNILILNGPFTGLKYINQSNGSQLLPKLVGSYEEPIHKWIYEILEQGQYNKIIDVGCAEGYYAVGLAKAKSTPKIFAFDLDKDALENAKRLAEKNGVSDAIFFGDPFTTFTVAKICQTDPTKKTLIFMDVEGAELDLLNPKKEPDILRCDILVELHDCFFPGLTEKIIERFQETHILKIVVAYPWRIKNYFLNAKEFNEEEKRFLFDERRPLAMRWMYAKVK